MSKRDAEIYREAAKLIEDGEEHYACRAICAVLGVSDPCASFDAKRDLPRHLYEPFAALFKTRDGIHGWFGSPWWFPERQDRRVIALCFMAAMAETGDL